MSVSYRSLIIDFLKGLAIVAVVLYHFGAWFPFGYLGVDIFFVVSGYLFVKGLYKSLEENSFNYRSFIIKKVVLLWPLILIVSALAVLLGYFLMLPYDYKNLAESAVASTLFANNIFQTINTGNYWDIFNLYKPLMHMWYIDVLMQAYIILPFFYILFVRLLKNTRKGLLAAGISMTAISLILFFLPLPQDWKFYHLPFRVFELSIGGLAALQTKDISSKKALCTTAISLIVILFMICSKIRIVSSSFMLLVVAAATSVIVRNGSNMKIKNRIFNVFTDFFAAIGRRSYSIYIWHQFFIAFLFYSVFPKQNIVSFSVFMVMTAVVSEISHRLIKSNLDKFIWKTDKIKRNFAILNLIPAVIICTAGSLIYLNFGVVRDVPELNISKDFVKRTIHKEYTDRVKHMKTGFDDPTKKHILVFGNSFGRDWTNILLEYDKKGVMEITYLPNSEENISTYAALIREADIVFYAEGPNYDGIPGYISEAVTKDKLYVVGNKNFGESNGIIYLKRYTKDYFKQKVKMPENLREQNDRESKIHGNHYINLMSAVTDENGMVKVFTDNNKFISNDCRHLTKAGAQYFAKTLDIGSIVFPDFQPDLKN